MAGWLDLLPVPLLQSSKPPAAQQGHPSLSGPRNLAVSPCGASCSPSRHMSGLWPRLDPGPRAVWVSTALIMRQSRPFTGGWYCRLDQVTFRPHAYGGRSTPERKPVRVVEAGLGECPSARGGKTYFVSLSAELVMPCLPCSPLPEVLITASLYLATPK